MLNHEKDSTLTAAQTAKINSYAALLHGINFRAIDYNSGDIRE